MKSYDAIEVSCDFSPWRTELSTDRAKEIKAIFTTVGDKHGLETKPIYYEVRVFSHKDGGYQIDFKPLGVPVLPFFVDLAEALNIPLGNIVGDTEDGAADTEGSYSTFVVWNVRVPA